MLPPITAKGDFDFLEDGASEASAENARKLYVAVSRAEKHLVLAVPKSQAQRVCKKIADSGAEVELTEIGDWR